MSEKVEIGKTLIKLKENNYDLTKLTSTERDYLQKISPEFIKAISNIGEVGSKAQEKVYDLINKAIDIFAEQLKDPNLSEEERNKINDRIVLMVEKSCEKDFNISSTFALNIDFRFFRAILIFFIQTRNSIVNDLFWRFTSCVNFDNILLPKLFWICHKPSSILLRAISTCFSFLEQRFSNDWRRIIFAIFTSIFSLEIEIQAKPNGNNYNQSHSFHLIINFLGFWQDPHLLIFYKIITIIHYFIFCQYLF